MTVLNGIVGPDGATVQVEVGVGRTVRQALRAAHKPIPQSITLTALIDTGADVSCIDGGALGRIALQPRRAFLLINAPGIAGLQYRPAYSAGLTVLHPSGRPADNLVIHDFLLAELPLQMPGCQLIFGRDALGHCRLDFDGRVMTFALEY